MTKKFMPAGSSAESRARQFIDDIIEINRRHGYGGEVPEEDYKRAIRQVTLATEAVKLSEDDHATEPVAEH